jgi:hypothetical protein
MDGYSVTEAASVLGVPEGRVWELLARGVIAGSSEGDSMRVFLKAEPSPIAPPAADSQRGERPRTNGNGGSHDGGEASAFRELLTEFRNLTERYGQALLALGEARGEVAGLRSRVELLEARIDLRLPAASAAEPAVAWAPLGVEPPEPMDEPIASPPLRKAPQRRASKRITARPKRGATPPRRKETSAGRQGAARFAAALARAEDPTISELPGGREAAEALAALQAEAAQAAEAVAPSEMIEEVVAEAPDEVELAADVQPAVEVEAFEESPGLTEAESVVAAELEAELEPGLDVELEAEPEPMFDGAAEIEPEPVVDVSPEAELTVAEPPAALAEPAPAAIEPDPDWFADGDFAWLDAAEMERTAPAAEEPSLSEATEPAPEQVPVEMAIPEPQAAASDLEPEPEAEPDDEPGWGGSPADTAAEADAEIQAAFDDVPKTTAATPAYAPPVYEPPVVSRETSEIQAAFDETPERPEAPQASVAVAADEVEVAVIHDVMPYGSVFSEPDVSTEADVSTSPDAVDTGSANEIPEEPGASELESASSLRGGTQPGNQASSATPSGLQLSDQELSQLAADEGWDASEVEAIRTLIGRGTQEPLGDLPGSGELRDAMAALDAVPVEPRGSDTQFPAEDEEWWRQPIRPVNQSVPPAPTRPGRPLLPERFGPGGSDEDWLRRRTGPAANAYRRIRRLFSG